MRDDNYQQNQNNIINLKKELFSRINDVLFYLLPNGHVKNDKFFVGDTSGNKGKSLVVELSGQKIGNWYDFATADGGDLLKLWSICRNKEDFGEVLDDIKRWLGSENVTYKSRQTKDKNIDDSKDANIDDLENINNSNSFKKSTTQSWNYLDENGKIIAIVYRLENDGKKEFRLFDNILKKFKAPNPRPLYNIPNILSSFEIILVEGEKCAQSLIDAGFVATTAMNGANAALEKTDWSPLKNKKVIIWPDNDEVGLSYVKKVAEFIADICDIYLLTPPSDKKLKWDSADAVLEGFDIPNFLLTAKKFVIESKVNIIKPISWQGTPPQRKWLIDDWLPQGYVSALYGDGGVGKSLLMQQLMTCLAVGRNWFGYEVKKTKVYGLMCEDNESELWLRQININKHLGITMPDLENLCFSSPLGKNNILMTYDRKDIGQLTPFFDDLLKEIISFDAKLVVLDTAADLFGGNEVNRIQVRQFIQNALGHIARTINGAVLLCAHPSDSGMQRKTGTGGSTAWSNTVRSRWYLSFENDDYENQQNSNNISNIRILSRKKSNYSAIGDKIYLKYQDGVFVSSNNKQNNFFENKLQNQKLNFARKQKEGKILNLIKEEALNGNIYTINQFCEKFEGKFNLGSKDTIRQRLNVYATNGKIKFFRDEDRSIIKDVNRSKFGYLCVKDMQLQSIITDQQNKNKSSNLISIFPTHYKHQQSGEILPLKKEEKEGNFWQENEEENEE